MAGSRINQPSPNSRDYDSLVQAVATLTFVGSVALIDRFD